MTCADGPFEFLARPYPYKRSPFQLTSGELVANEGVYFSLPASGLLLDKRLFTDASSHPVPTTIKLYVNRDANLFSTIEPDDDGFIYQSGTPHYTDYITDMRALITDVTALHAADSDHTTRQFFTSHLARARLPYDLSAFNIAEDEYVHPTPVNTVPSGATPPGVSGSVPPPGDGFELGAQQMMDIDMDEIQWQSFSRPKRRLRTLPLRLVVEPIFPKALNGGALPSLSTLDEIKLDERGLNGSSSGGIIITGDGLFTGTSMKLATNSGVVPDGAGNFIQGVPWVEFPCGRELCNYYGRHGSESGVITALGRQSIYAEPSIATNGVYMLIVSDVSDTSGFIVQHWPANYSSSSGIDADGHAHEGVHITDKLIYNIVAVIEDGEVLGHSPMNGTRVHSHWVGQEAGSAGETYSSVLKYSNGDNIFGAGRITQFLISFEDFRSRQNWFSTNNTFSPVSWENLTTDNLGANFSSFFGSSVTWFITDIQAGTDKGVVTKQSYAGWGSMDRMIVPDEDRSQGGQTTTEVINFHTIIYNEGTDSQGNFVWIFQEEVDTTQDVTFSRNAYSVNNIFAFFFDRKSGTGLANVNGQVYHQWNDKSGGVDALPRNNKFAFIGNGTDRLVPPTNRSETITSIGFFPSWVRQLRITTNNQISVPDLLQIVPGGSKTITFHPDLNFDSTFVDTFGPAVWDPVAGVNYLYFFMVGPFASFDRKFFAHMDTNFCIIRFNQIPPDEDGILNGRAALLSL